MPKAEEMYEIRLEFEPSEEAITVEQLSSYLTNLNKLYQVVVNHYVEEFQRRVDVRGYAKNADGGSMRRALKNLDKRELPAGSYELLSSAADLPQKDQKNSESARKRPKFLENLPDEITVPFSDFGEYDEHLTNASRMLKVETKKIFIHMVESGEVSKLSNTEFLDEVWRYMKKGAFDQGLTYYSRNPFSHESMFHIEVASINYNSPLSVNLRGLLKPLIIVISITGGEVDLLSGKAQVNGLVSGVESVVELIQNSIVLDEIKRREVERREKFEKAIQDLSAKAASAEKK